MRRASFYFWPLVLAVLGLVACASPTTQAPTATPQRSGKVLFVTPSPQARPKGPPGPVAMGATPEAPSLVVAVSDVGPRLYSLSELQWPYSQRNLALGIYEPLLLYLGDGIDAYLAEDWEVSHRGVTFTIRPGVRFHGDYGEVTAEDVAFSISQASAEGSRWPDAQLLAQEFGSPMVEGNRLFLPFKRPGILWLKLVSADGNPLLVESRRVFDEKGTAYATLKPVGTGPFRVVEHQPASHIVLESVPDHWRAVPAVSRIRIVQVPEEARRIAMLRSGEADVAQVGFASLHLVMEVPGLALRRGPVGGKNSLVVFPAGQYYIATREDGSPTGRQPLTELPWVGDPTDPDSMDRALKVRLAMSMALDRRYIVDSLLMGQGTPQFAMALDTSSPLWREEWQVPYDPEGARNLLAEAGYPQGFAFDFYVPTGISTVLEQTADALVDMWKAVGLRPQVIREPYVARRPQMQSRAMDDVWLFIWAVSESPASLAEQMGRWTDRSTWNPGLEFPQARDFQDEALSEPDPARAWEVALRWVDWSFRGQLAIPVATFQAPWVTGPRIASWDMPIHTDRWPSGLETVTLR